MYICIPHMPEPDFMVKAQGAPLQTAISSNGKSGMCYARIYRLKFHQIIRWSQIAISSTESVFTKLVGGFNPFEKYYIVKLDHFPRDRDENKKCLSCHHLVIKGNPDHIRIHKALVPQVALVGPHSFQWNDKQGTSCSMSRPLFIWPPWYRRGRSILHCCTNMSCQAGTVWRPGGTVEHPKEPPAVSV